MVLEKINEIDKPLRDFSRKIINTQIINIRNERRDVTQDFMYLKVAGGCNDNFMLNFEKLDEVVNFILFSLQEGF